MGEAIQFWHRQRVASTDGGQRLSEAGAVKVAAGEAMVSTDAVLRHAELDQRAALGGKVLFVGRAADVPDERVCHWQDFTDRQHLGHGALGKNSRA